MALSTFKNTELLRQINRTEADRLKKFRLTLPLLAVAILFVVVLYPRLFGPPVYTLYRNSVTDVNVTGHSAVRIHVATFDANEAGSYNQENCEVASRLFKQEGVRMNYWCEQGYHKR